MSRNEVPKETGKEREVREKEADLLISSSKYFGMHFSRMRIEICQNWPNFEVAEWEYKTSQFKYTCITDR